MNKIKSIDLYFDFIETLLEDYNNYDYIVFNLSILYFRKEALKIGFKDNLLTRLKNLANRVNVFIPSFTFLEHKEKVFDILHTNPTLGWLNDQFFKEYQDSFKSPYIARSPSCIHSFIVIGPEARQIVDSISPFYSFGELSVWNYFYKNRGFWCEIGTEPKNSFSIIHDCEMSANVPYRENIEFNVHYIDTNHISKSGQYSYFARKKDISSYFNFNKITTLAAFQANNLLLEIDSNSYIHEYRTLHKLLVSQLEKEPKFFCLD